MDTDEGRKPKNGSNPVTRRGARQFHAAMPLLELAQDLVTVLVGVTLIVLAAGLLVTAIIDFFHSSQPMLTRATSFLDEILLVLILVEIVHTVMLSMRSHELHPEPFIVVGLIAAIRKLLFVLSGQKPLSTSQFVLYLATAAVFIVALVAVRRWAPVGDASNRPA